MDLLTSASTASTGEAHRISFLNDMVSDLQRLLSSTLASPCIPAHLLQRDTSDEGSSGIQSRTSIRYNRTSPIVIVLPRQPVKYCSFIVQVEILT